MIVYLRIEIICYKCVVWISDQSKQLSCSYTSGKFEKCRFEKKTFKRLAEIWRTGSPFAELPITFRIKFTHIILYNIQIFGKWIKKILTIVYFLGIPTKGPILTTANPAFRQIAHNFYNSTHLPTLTWKWNITFFTLQTLIKWWAINRFSINSAVAYLFIKPSTIFSTAVWTVSIYLLCRIVKFQKIIEM